MMYRDSAFLQKLFPEVLCTLLIPQTQFWVIVIFFPSSRIALPMNCLGRERWATLGKHGSASQMAKDYDHTWRRRNLNSKVLILHFSLTRRLWLTFWDHPSHPTHPLHNQVDVATTNFRKQANTLESFLTMGQNIVSLNWKIERQVGREKGRWEEH